VPGRCERCPPAAAALVAPSDRVLDAIQPLAGGRPVKHLMRVRGENPWAAAVCVESLSTLLRYLRLPGTVANSARGGRRGPRGSEEFAAGPDQAGHCRGHGELLALASFFLS
jgi:hypothetical protein